MRARIALLVATNLFVGMMVGLERANLPLLAEREFGVASASAALAFLLTFGLAKAATNLGAGALADRFGRKRVLVAGWLVGLPVPVVLLVAPSWGWVVAANALLGVNQGLAWSMTLNMKIDLVTPRRRGLVVGLNEAAGYLGVALAAFLAGVVAAGAGLRAPYAPGVGVALVGLGLSLATRETRPPAAVAPRPLAHAFAEGTWRDASRATASFAGLATNLKDGVVWGALPLVLAARGVDLAVVGVVAGVYPATWGLAQVATGPLTDRHGRRGLAVAGLALQAVAMAALLAPGVGALVGAAVLLGLGTALAYPALLAHVADVAPDAERASALGVYRAWRDAGYAAGAVVAGVALDAVGLAAPFLAAAGVLGIAAAAFAAGSGPPDTKTRRHEDKKEKEPSL